MENRDEYVNVYIDPKSFTKKYFGESLADVLSVALKELLSEHVMPYRVDWIDTENPHLRITGTKINKKHLEKYSA